MDSFQQSCPFCQAVLELPCEAIGKRSICPACQNEFVANNSAGNQSPPNTARLPPQYQSVAIETIFGDTQSLFSARRRPLFLPFLIPSLVFAVTVFLPLGLLNAYARTNTNRALIYLAVLSPVFFVVGSYILCITLQIANGACEIEDAEEQAKSDWFRKTMAVRGRLLLRTLIAVLALSMLVAITFIVSAVMIQQANLSTSVQISMSLYAATVVFSVLLYSVAVSLMWPLLPLAQTDVSELQMFAEAMNIARVNLFNSFLIAVAISFLLAVGSALLGIGLLITVPIATLVLVVAFRRTTGKAIPVIDNL